MKPQWLQRTGNGGGIGLHPRREFPARILRIRNPEAATGIDVTNLMTIAAQGFYEGSDPLHGLAERTDVGDLRTNVHAYPGSPQVARVRTQTIECGRLAHGDAEFVLVQASRNIGGRLSGQLGVNPHGETRGLA